MSGTRTERRNAVDALKPGDDEIERRRVASREAAHKSLRQALANLYRAQMLFEGAGDTQWATAIGCAIEELNK